MKRRKTTDIALGGPFPQPLAKEGSQTRCERGSPSPTRRGVKG